MSHDLLNIINRFADNLLLRARADQMRVPDHFEDARKFQDYDFEKIETLHAFVVEIHEAGFSEPKRIDELIAQCEGIIGNTWPRSGFVFANIEGVRGIYEPLENLWAIGARNKHVNDRISNVYVNVKKLLSEALSKCLDRLDKFKDLSRSFLDVSKFRDNLLPTDRARKERLEREIDEIRRVSTDTHVEYCKFQRYTGSVRLPNEAEKIIIKHALVILFYSMDTVNFFGGGNRTNPFIVRHSYASVYELYFLLLLFISQCTLDRFQRTDGPGSRASLCFQALNILYPREFPTFAAFIGQLFSIRQTIQTILEIVKEFAEVCTDLSTFSRPPYKRSRESSL